MIVRVRPRIEAKRPEIVPDDARAAFLSALAKRARKTEPVQYVGVGLDDHGRLLEFVAVEQARDEWLIYHCAPPTKGVLKELGLRR